MSLIVLVVVVLVLLNCGALFQIDAFNSIYNIFRGFGDERRFNEFMRDYVEPTNRQGWDTATSLGGIGNTTQMAGDLYGRARGLAGSLSNQANIDTNQRYNQLGASAQAGLRARAIGGSTVAPSVAYANERNRGAELRLNNDDRIRTLLGVEESFGGGEIAANQEAADTRLRALGMRYMIAPGQSTPAMTTPR
jgi:hypothetical protein